jgi:hypothetical protein
LLGGVITAVVTGGFDLVKVQNEQGTGLRLKELDRQAAVFQHLMIIDPDTIAGADDGGDIETKALNERRARICLAASFGLIEVPDYVLGVDRSNREKYAALLEEKLNRNYQCHNASLPQAFPARLPAVLPTFVCPTPAELAASAKKMPTLPGLARPSARTLLEAAVGEMNKGVHEICNREPILGYMKTVNFVDPEIKAAWSAIFTSWLISKTGNQKQIDLSARHQVVWESARSVGAGFDLGANQQVQVGDIIVARRVMPNGRPFEGPGGWLGRSGVVYSVGEGTITFISGNIRNGVGFSTIGINDPNIVGVIRP